MEQRLTEISFTEETGQTRNNPSCATVPRFLRIFSEESDVRRWACQYDLHFGDSPSVAAVSDITCRVTTETYHFMNSWRSSGQPSFAYRKFCTAKTHKTHHIILQAWEYITQARTAAPLGSYCCSVCWHQAARAAITGLDPFWFTSRQIWSHTEASRVPQAPLLVIWHSQCVRTCTYEAAVAPEPHNHLESRKPERSRFVVP